MWFYESTFWSIFVFWIYAAYHKAYPYNMFHRHLNWQSCLLIISSNYEHLNGVILTDLSDHLPIISISNLKALGQNKATVNYTTRIINDSSLQLFANDLQNYDWQSVLSLYDPTESLNAFYNAFYDLYDKRFPKKIIKTRHEKTKEYMDI